jgi:hypothetical protein
MRIILSLIGIAIVGIAILYGTGQVSDYGYYRGQEVFYTEQEYIKFKQALVDYEVTIEDIDVLSSEPPIIVKFAIYGVEKPDVFPYGEKINTGIGMAMFIGVIGIAVTGISVFAGREE